jgi:excisionase family DNA binding protein
MQTDEVMDYKGLSAYLKMAQNTLRHKVMHGKIPFFKIGKYVRFSKKDIGLWLEKHGKEPDRNFAGKKTCVDLFSGSGGLNDGL